MKFLDYIGRHFQAYRRWRGGTWYLLRFKPLPYLVSWFRNAEPDATEAVEAVEIYPVFSISLIWKLIGAIYCATAWAYRRAKRFLNAKY